MGQITEKGKQVGSASIKLKDVEGESSLINFYNEEKTKNETKNKEISNSSPQDLIDKGLVWTPINRTFLQTVKYT